MLLTAPSWDSLAVLGEVSDMAKPVRILVVGVGNMGLSHARAYAANPGFQIAGFWSRAIEFI